MNRLSVVIVNFNGKHLLEDCLGGLEAQLRPADEVIVVDNSSVDGSVEYIKQMFPWIRLIEAGTNLGFAAGNNVGIRAATGDIVVLLNNDTLPSPGFLEEIASPLERSDSVSAVAGVMLFSTSGEHVASTGIEVHTNGLALDRDIGVLWRDLPEQAEVFGPSGGAAAFRRNALDDTELFAEPYFLYLEDVDLAWRLRLRGHRTVSIRDAWVLHVYSASSVEGSAFKDFYLARNRAWTLIRCWPGSLWGSRWFSVVTYELMALLHAVLTRRWSSIAGRWHGWSALRRLLKSRRTIQARVTSTTDELLYWMRSDQSVRGHLKAREIIRSLTKSDEQPDGV